MNRLRFRFLDILVTVGMLIFLEAGAASAATVRQGAWELALEKPVYQVGEPLTLSCRIPEQAGERWIGFVPVDFPRGAEYNQRSTRTAVSEIRTPHTDCADAAPLVAPQQPGRYQLRLGSGSDPAGPCLTIPFAVAPPRGALTLARTHFAPGEKIEVAYTVPAGSDRPSVVLMPPEVPHGAAEAIAPRQVAYQYLAVAAERNTLVAPNRLGAFELRLLSSDRGVELASVPVELALPAAGESYTPAEERIFSFASDITVHPDGELVVSETIEVWADQREIRHGIYRDFPTLYHREGALLPQMQGFAVVAAERDGQPEPYFTRRLANGVRVYLGAKEAYVPAGRHIYRLTYRTDRQLGLFADRDELYWNVTGNGWVFPINRVTARVRLPAGTGVTTTDAYTGLQGAREKAFTVVTTADGGALFTTTQPLERNQGLTIVAAWPKGSIAPPGFLRRGLFLLRDLTQLPNRLLILGLLVALGYYLVVWHRHGRDPRVGIIVPRYAPPAGLCPAALRFYSRHERYDHQTFTAAVVSLAVKRFLTISQLEPGTTSCPRRTRPQTPRHCRRPSRRSCACSTARMPSPWGAISRP